MLMLTLWPEDRTLAIRSILTQITGLTPESEGISNSRN